MTGYYFYTPLKQTNKNFQHRFKEIPTTFKSCNLKSSLIIIFKFIFNEETFLEKYGNPTRIN